MLKGIYLAAFKANHEDYNIVYQDINGKRDIGGDMLDIDLSPYDYVIATPPCNYWSVCNYRRETSKYAQATKHLLFDTIKKLYDCGKPFLVENVRNLPLMSLYMNDLPFDIHIFVVGRHTYFSNVLFDISDIPQRQDFLRGGIVIKYDDMENLDHQGGYNVHQVVERFLATIHKGVKDCNV